MNLFKKFFIFHLFFLSLFADVNLSMDESVVKGKPFVFTLELSGSEIKIPNFSQIDGNSVQEISSSLSTTIINGKVSKLVKKSYSFIPTKDFIFPALTFEIDGKKYETQQKNIKLIKATKTQSSLYDLTIKTSKNDIFVGENFVLTLKLKFKKDLQLVGLALDKPTFKDFWYKQLDETKKYEDGDFYVIETNFLMSPLKEGKLQIDPLTLQMRVMDVNPRTYFPMAKDIDIYSNELNFDVKSLPNGVKIIGDFSFESSIDKQEIKKGDSIAFKIKISGSGNIDDISDIKLPLEDAIVYENKPEIKTEISSNKYIGSYEKVFSIVPNKSFTIPSINFEYFDKNENRVVIKQTKSYEIKVIDVDNSKEVKLEKQQIVQNNDISNKKEIIYETKDLSLIEKLSFFVLGIGVTLVFVYIYFYFKNYKQNKKEQSSPLLKRVKNSKTKDELIKILAIYLKIDLRLDELIFRLEKNEEFKTIKSEIIKILKELKI